MQRLHIVVPYRDRAAHLAAFVPHLRAYFSRDKLDRDIPYHVTVVEQEPGLPFNRGALKNVGFTLGRQASDYTCFHDVDYLPVWADYSAVDVPTAILWYGAETRPIAPGRSELFVREDMSKNFGGVVLVPNAAFAAVDGAANGYWGWGYEDVDLHARFRAARMEIGRRKGTFSPLPHDSVGHVLDGRPSPIAVVNRAKFHRRWITREEPFDDGLSTLAFDVLDRRTIEDPAPERVAPWEVVTVRLRGGPDADQAAALAGAAP